MNIASTGLNKVKNFTTNIFYKHTFQVVLLLFTLLMTKVIQIEYKIKNFNYWLIILLYITALFIFILFTKFLTKWYKKIIAAAVPFILLLAVGLYNFNEVYIEINKLRGFFASIESSFYNSTPTYFYQFITAFIVVVPLFLLIMLYLERKGFGNVLISISLLYLFTFWYSAELFELQRYMLIYMILCSVTFCINRLNKLKAEYKNRNIKISIENKRIINYFVVIAILASAFAYLFVNKVNSRSLIVTINERLAKSNRMLQKSKNNSYDISYSGYTNSSVKLGGPIKLSSDKVLRVKGEETYYLKGSVKDYYDGFSWNRDSYNYKTQEKEPLRNFTTPFYEYMRGNAEPGSVEKKSITVYPEQLFNSSIFAPSFSYNIKLSYGYVAYDDTESYLILGNTGVRSPYNINFYKSKSGIEFFEKAYENNIEMNYSLLQKDEKVKDRYSKYLQLPDNISPRTYELVEAITKDCKSDGEKVKRISDYLSRNYTYTLDVSELPNKKEFVDYFLFTEKKGYCTYFATSAAVLFRIAGIPARYVEGFAMSDLKDEEGNYIVTNEMAHAWTEILMYPEEEIWSIVDCTPSSQREQYIKSHTNSEQDIIPGSIADNSKEEKNTALNNKNIILNKSVKYISLVLLAGFILFIAYVAVKIIILKVKKRRIIKSNSAVLLYYFVKGRLKWVYKNIAVTEDDYVWIESIEDTALKEIVIKLIDTVYKETYRKSLNCELNKKDVYKSVEANIRLKQKVFKYYFYKILKS